MTSSAREKLKDIQNSIASMVEEAKRDLFTPPQSQKKSLFTRMTVEELVTLSGPKTTSAQESTTELAPSTRSLSTKKPGLIFRLQPISSLSRVVDTNLLPTPTPRIFDKELLSYEQIPERLPKHRMSQSPIPSSAKLEVPEQHRQSLIVKLKMKGKGSKAIQLKLGQRSVPAPDPVQGKSVKISPPAANPAPKVELSEFSDELGEEIVRFMVGPKRKSIVVHKKLLCHRSPLADRYFQEHPLSDIYYLPTADPKSISKVAEFLYRGVISPSKCMLPQEGANPTTQARAAISSKITLYSVAQLLGIPSMMEQAMDDLIKTYIATKLRPNPLEMAQVYKETIGNNGLRRFMARSYQYTLMACPEPKSRSNETQKFASGFPTNEELRETALKYLELEVDVMCLMRDMWQGGKPPKLEDPIISLFCDFHQHKPEELCPSKGKRHAV